MSVPGVGIPAVSIREVGPRDGLQIEDPVSLAEKLRLVDALAATGVSRIEATSFVSPRAVPALADAELLAAELHQWPGIEFSALVAGIGGAKRAVAAGMKTVEYVVSASNGHSEANTRSTTEQATERIGEVVRIVHDGGGRVEVIVATAWDCPFDGPTDPDRVLRIAEQAKEFGADQFSIADTIGTATPGRVGRLIDAVGERVGDFGLVRTSTTRVALVLLARLRLCSTVFETSTRPPEVSAVVRSLPVPVATSRRRNWSTCSKTWALRQVSTWMRAFVPLPLQRR